jgi:hypothetical protein
MWNVDFQRYGSPKSASARAILAHLVETMDQQTQTAEIDVALRRAFPQQAISAGLIQLKHLGIIRRAGDSRIWGKIWINPSVVCPYWLKGQLLRDAQDTFDQGPTGLGKKLQTKQNPQGEMPRGPVGGPHESQEQDTLKVGRGST